MKPCALEEQIQAGRVLAREVDSWLCGVGSKDNVRRALTSYWETVPVPPPLADSVEWKA